MGSSADRCLNVYIIGAQCTGKTTIVNTLETYLSTPGLPAPTIIREVARTVLKDKGYTREDITSSPTRALELQHHILDAQLAAEQAISADDSTVGYICDRSGLDPIIYAHLYVGKDASDTMLASSAWRDLERRMKAGIVMLCEAGCSWLIDDGTRLMPAGLEDWMRVDKAFRELLERTGIIYSIIPSGLHSIEERVALVIRAMGE